MQCGVSQTVILKLAFINCDSLQRVRPHLVSIRRHRHGQTTYLETTNIHTTPSNGWLIRILHSIQCLHTKITVFI